MKEDISSITTSLLTFCFHSNSTDWLFGAKGFQSKQSADSTNIYASIYTYNLIWDGLGVEDLYS